MHLRKLTQLGLILGGLILLGAACSEAPPEGDCLTGENGQLVPVPCIAGENPTPLNTPTPVLATDNTNGSETVGTATGGLSIFLGEGTCNVCHSIDGIPQANGQIGPNLTQIGLRGEDYIRESILDPDAVIAMDCPTGPCPSGTMIQTFSSLFSEEQIDDLVGYLLTLE